MSCSALAAPVRVPGTRVAGARPAAVRRASLVVPRASADDVYDVVVVGAGVSGLSTAFTLGRAKPDAKMLVTEARDCVGGNITSRSDDRGYVWEEGPNSYQPGDPILTVACDAGMRDDILLADPNSDRYVLWDKELRALPKRHPHRGPRDVPDVAREDPRGPRRDRHPPPARGKEESVKESSSRNLGVEAFERLIEPFCSGVYAGDPAMLRSVAATGRVQRLEPLGGSLVAGALKAQKQAYDEKKASGFVRDARLPAVEGQTVGSFRGGLKTFPEGLAKAIGTERVMLEWTLKKMSKRPDGSFELEYATKGPGGDEASRTITAKSVVMTAPAYAAGRRVQEMAPKAAEALREFLPPRRVRHRLLPGDRVPSGRHLGASRRRVDGIRPAPPAVAGHPHPGHHSQLVPLQGRSQAA